MPFRNFQEFTPSMLLIMSAAYDALAADLGIDGTHDPHSSKLAIKIVEMVRAGEDDKDALIRMCRTAFEKELGKSRKR